MLVDPHAPRELTLTTGEFARPRAPGDRPVQQFSVLGTVLLAAGLLIADQAVGDTVRLLSWEIVILALLFQTLDGSAGMGFGTALAPLLLALGHPPLAVVPALLLAQAVGGLLAGSLHHEHDNVRFSLTWPLNDATRTVVVVAAAGVVATLGSILLGYLAFTLPEAFIERYVAILVLVMAAVALAQATGVIERPARPLPSRRRLGVFAALAGANKGLGGGGYGPVMVLGLLFSGYREKRAAAIVVMAEGLVSLVGAGTYLALSRTLPLDLRLLPSILLGSIAGAIVAPGVVRALPLRVLRVAIPAYALAIGTWLIVGI